MVKKYLMIPEYTDIKNLNGMTVAEVIDYLKGFDQNVEFVDYTEYYGPDYRLLTYRQETETEYQNRQNRLKQLRKEAKYAKEKIKKQLIKDCKKLGIKVIE